jgi:5-aminopentanamidase
VLILPDGGEGGGGPGGGGKALTQAHEVTLGLYRKVHLFNEETRWMRPGDLGFPVFRWRGVTLGMLICFDWLFPEATRCLALQGMDLLLHPSNLVLPYCQDAMRTRAIENSIFAVTANRVGSENRAGNENALTFTGISQVVGPKGEILCRAGRDEEMRVVDVDPALARARQITPHNDVLGDRRPECYGRLTAKS